MYFFFWTIVCSLVNYLTGIIQLSIAETQQQTRRCPLLQQTAFTLLIGANERAVELDSACFVVCLNCRLVAFRTSGFPPSHSCSFDCPLGLCFPCRGRPRPITSLGEKLCSITGREALLLAQAREISLSEPISPWL